MQATVSEENKRIGETNGVEEIRETEVINTSNATGDKLSVD